MTTKKIAAIAVVSLFLASAFLVPVLDGTISNADSQSDIRDYIMGVTYDPKTDIVQDVGVEQIPMKLEDKSSYTITTKYELKTTENDPSAVLCNSASYESKTYPGALVRGNHNLANGTPDSVLTDSRSDMSYTINLPGIDQNFTANPQLYGDINNAITAKVDAWKANPTTIASMYTSQSTEGNSTQQISCDLDLTAEQLLDLGLSANWTSDGTETTYVMKFTQVYYTVSTVCFNSPEKYFGSTQTVDTLKNQIYNNCMATVVDTVTYGSTVYACITSTETSDEAQEALNLVICGNEESLTSEQKKIVDNCTVTISIYGGKYESNPSTIDEVRTMLENTAITADNISAAKPIQYTTCFITDGSRAACNNNTQYNEATTVITSEISYSFEFTGGYVGNIRISYQTFDDIDDEGKYTGTKTVTDYHDNLCCGATYQTTITAKHFDTITIEELRTDGYSAVVSNYKVYPLSTLDIYYGGTICENHWDITVDGTSVSSN